MDDCALLFFATTVNYLDRQVLSLLKPALEVEFNWSDTDYANIVMVFQFVYAISMLFAGRIIDWLGTKAGFAWALVVWSVGAVLHAFAKGTGGFMFARAVLGFGESGNFPAAIKTTAEWFPKRERALATGISTPAPTSAPSGAPHGALDSETHWLAGCVYHRGRNRFPVAHFLVLALCGAGEAEAAGQAGVRLHSQRR